MKFKLKNNRELRIVNDPMPENPRENEQLGTMICFHSKYDLGDETLLKSSDFNGWDDLENHLKNTLKATAILPLYLYDHSGLTMCTSPFSCRFDSGQVGFIYITEEVAFKEFGKNYDIKKLTKYLEEEVKTYDQYLVGDVYGFEIIKDGEIEDSCYGFYGSDIKTNGMLGNLSSEDRTSIFIQLDGSPQSVAYLKSVTDEDESDDS